MNGMGLRTSARCEGLEVGYQAQVPNHPIDIKQHNKKLRNDTKTSNKYYILFMESKHKKQSPISISFTSSNRQIDPGYRVAAYDEAILNEVKKEEH